MSTALNQQCWCSSEAQGLALIQVCVWPLHPLAMLLRCVTMLSCARCSECWCRGSLDTLCTLSQWHCWRPLYWALRGDGVRRGYMHCPTRYFEFRKPDVDPTFSAYFIYFSSILYLYSLQHHRYFILLIKYWKLNMMNNVKNDNIVSNF